MILYLEKLYFIEYMLIFLEEKDLKKSFKK